MLEITFEHKDIFELFKENEHVYKDGVYDFTFEGRFAIYHCQYQGELAYIALDMETGYGSVVTRKKDMNLYSPDEFTKMIPLILNAIKYTGDRRSSSIINSEPTSLIEYIFKTVMPRYGYALRHEQMSISKAMYRTLNGKLLGICEAEVGCGKTLAYLVAALVARTRLPSYKMTKPITIATSSIELQSSIVEKDIPRLSEILYEHDIIYKPLKVVLRKGKEHYMCYSRYNAFMNELKAHPIKNKKLIAFFENNKFEKRGFDLDKIKLPQNIKEKICVKGSCSRCPFADKCRYGNFLQECQYDSNIDIQVTNHNLYLASRKNSHEILRSSSFVIIDEAHKFKDAALDIFGTRISSKEVKSFIRATSELIKEGTIEPQYRIVVMDLKKEIKSLFSSIKKYVVDEDDESNDTLVELTEREKIKIYKIITLLNDLESKERIVGSEYKYWLTSLIEAFVSFTHTYDSNVWVERTEADGIVLCSNPKNIGSILYEKVWNKDSKHILTSGTMSDDKSFNYFKEQNGINMINSEYLFEKTTPSPFNYKDHTRLYIPKDMPTPDNTEGYYKAIADRVVSLIKVTNGHTAVLFTSYKMLWAVYDFAKDRLKKYELFVMNRGDGTAIKNFKNSKNGVLFASGAMWEGVDCPGDCLSSVIITKLPFPIRNAQMEQRKKECKDTFDFINRYATPEMIIKLRQGVGRLIRTETDTGLVSILDARATDSFCSKNVRSVLAKYPTVTSMNEASTFMKQVKRKEYFDN